MDEFGFTDISETLNKAQKIADMQDGGIANTCGKCRYYVEAIPGEGDCSSFEIIDLFDLLVPLPKTFGCIHWEEKEK